MVVGEEARIFRHAPQMFVVVPVVHLPRSLRLEYCACFRRAENAMGLAFGSTLVPAGVRVLLVLLLWHAWHILV